MTCIPLPLMRIPDLQVFTGAFERGRDPVHWYHMGFGWADGGADGRSFQWEATETLYVTVKEPVILTKNNVLFFS